MVRNSQVHIMYNGESHDVNMDVLDIGDLSTDAQVREAVARHFDVPLEKLRNFTIDRNEETGDMTLRPNAVFGI